MPSKQPEPNRALLLSLSLRVSYLLLLPPLICPLPSIQTLTISPSAASASEVLLRHIPPSLPPSLLPCIWLPLTPRLKAGRRTKSASLTSSFWASSWVSFASLRCVAFFWARELMDARLQLQTHAQNIRIETDGWECVLDLIWKKKCQQSINHCKQKNWTEEKERKINNSASNWENIAKALVTDNGKSEKDRRKPKKKKTINNLKMLRKAHIPNPHILALLRCTVTGPSVIHYCICSVHLLNCADGWTSSSLHQSDHAYLRY